MYRKQVYIYPDRSYSLKPDTNPYIKDLVIALKANGTEVIRSKTAWLGVIDIFLYIKTIDAVIFNWVEDVVNRKMGYVQAIALLFLIPVLKLFGVKIIWTIHNKVSHSPHNRYISNYFRKLLSKKSDMIVAHSKESAKELGTSRIIYYPHPFKVNQNKECDCVDYEYDVLFWGTILPYKGIKEFLEYIHAKGHHDLRICVQGRCPDAGYLHSLKKLETTSIAINDIFTSDNDLKFLFQKSKAVVFTYRSESVLSSGALIESLGNYKTIFGPNFGNFKDCEQEGIIYTYSSFDELVQMINALVDNRLSYIDKQKIEKYIKSYSWESYANFLGHHINKNERCEIGEFQ